VSWSLTNIGQTASTTVVTSSVNPAILHQAVTFTASVHSTGSGTPTGTVQFQVDGVNVGGPVTLTNGSAKLTTAALTVGPHTVTAVYGGDSNFLGSSGSLTQSVHYKFSGFLDPLEEGRTYHLGRTLPIKFQLTDYNGNAITDLSAVQSLKVARVNPDGSTGAPFDPASDRGLHVVGHHFELNWKTGGLAAGTYQIQLRLNDGTLHTLTLRLEAHGDDDGGHCGDE
jgi:hypothetical protein